MTARELAVAIETKFKIKVSRDHSKFLEGKLKTATTKVHNITMHDLVEYTDINLDIKKEAIQIYNDRNENYVDWIPNLPPHGWDCTYGYEKALEQKQKKKDI